LLLSVIIVNYNVKYFLEYCLFSVEKALKNIEGEVFVVDNNSTDGSRDFFINKFPRVNFIWNTENEGFAKANNKALHLASGNYILFLNPDTIVSEDCFEKCVSFIQSKNNSVASGVKMVDGSGKFLKESKRAFPSPMTSLYKLSGLTKIFPHSKIFSKYHLGYLNENVNHEIDVLAGAFMMMPKNITDSVGGFDEDFFMYGEDIDLSYRIQKAGYKNFFFAETTIIHFKGGSTKKGSLNYVKLFYKAMSVFVKKHYANAGAGFYKFFLQAAIILRGSVSAISKIVLSTKNSAGLKKSKPKNTIVIVGTKAQCSEITELLKERKLKKIICLSPDPLDNSELSAIEILNKLKETTALYPEYGIVLCEGFYSFKTIIDVTEKLSLNTSIQFYFSGAASIINA
jgi:GT2 family glycosyltransferase